jgi:diguanylate cyclase (GGDEF)-like protein/PAS domain S-box-containing protein
MQARTLEEQLDLLRGTLESTTDGILVVDESGGIIAYNQRFATLWNIPESILKSRKDEEALSYVLTQLKNPDAFMQKVRELYSQRDASSYDILEFKDGRIFERFSQPHPGLARSQGRVWSFRDVSERKRTENALRESEERYRSLVRQAKEGIFILDPEDGRIQEANPFFLQMFGYEESEVAQLSIFDLVAEERTSVEANIRMVLGMGAITLPSRHHRKKDGTLLDLEVRASLITIGDARVILVNLTDIAERKHAQAMQSALYRISEVMTTTEDMDSFYAAIHDIFSELMSARNFYIALYDSENQTLSFPYFVDELDTPPPPTPLGRGLTEYVLRTGQPELVSPERFKQLVSLGEVEEVGPESVDWLGVPLKSGDRTFGVLVVQSYTGEIRFGEKEMEVLTFVSRHIANALERKQAAETIRHLAFHDALTGLPNRTLFRDRLTQALAHAHRKNELLAMLFLDLDRFKTINDTLGHAIGDRLLQAVAERLRKSVREGDTIARLGGDEFMLLLQGVPSLEGLAKVAQKMLRAFRPSFHVAGHDLHITTSIGISVYPHDGQDPEAMLKNADTALYRAKEQGRNNYQLYTPSMNARALEQLALENQLRRALDSEQFVLYYQPVLDLKTRKIAGMEALIRWVRPAMTMIMPNAFIPMAEDTGLIIPIGEWVIQTACAQNGKWQKQGLLEAPVSVNLSARQFQQEDLTRSIARCLELSGLSPRFLTLEITESAIMKNADSAIATLLELKAMGVRISIDDFGIGYSSLSHLKSLPITSLKIDQSFVRDCMVDADDAAIVTAIISLARSLKLEVVAEGVETEEQIGFLDSLGCDKLQGYFFSRPLPAEAFTTLLQKGDV